MSKRYWIPVLIGTVTAIIGFLITYADLTIYIGVNPRTGMPLGYDGREIFLVLCSALGGPLALLIALLQFPLIGLYLSLPASGVVGIVLDRLVAGLAVVFLYRLMVLRVKRLPFILLFWAVTIWAYYTISLNITLVAGCILSGRSILEAYRSNGIAVLNVLPSLEPPFTYLFSVLILLAIPPRFRRPLWIHPRETGSSLTPGPLKSNVT